MQVFIIGSPLDTAINLDTRRLNKQIIECQQILNAINGNKAWKNHPCTLQYKGHEVWLNDYMSCLMWYRIGDLERANICSSWCDINKPNFHTQEYFNQMKRRLYTKDKEHYKQWSSLGESDVNWYFVGGNWIYYKNGKKIIL